MSLCMSLECPLFNVSYPQARSHPAYHSQVALIALQPVQPAVRAEGHTPVALLVLFREDASR